MTTPDDPDLNETRAELRAQALQNYREKDASGSLQQKPEPLRTQKRAQRLGLISGLSYLITAFIWTVLLGWWHGETFFPTTRNWEPGIIALFILGIIFLFVLVIWSWGMFIYHLFKDDRYYTARARFPWIVFGMVMATIILAKRQIIPQAWLDSPLEIFINWLTVALAAFFGYLVAFKLLYRERG